MDWFLIALLPPALWSVTNHFDKYLLSRFFKGGGVGALMIFSSIIGALLLPIIAFLHPEVLHFSSTSFLIAINGFLYVLAILPNLYALQKDEASVCIPLFQLIPVISFLLAYLVLGESLARLQIAGGALVIAGAIGISLDLSSGAGAKFKRDVFFLMFFSSLLFSLNFLFFKYFALQSDFWFTSFWEYLGFATFALLLVFFSKPYREQFFTILRINRTAILGLNGVNEIINIAGKVAFNIASLLTPVTLVWITNGLQPFFVFLYGIILTLLFPKISQETLSRKVILQKIIAIFIMFIGVYLINRAK